MISFIPGIFKKKKSINELIYQNETELIKDVENKFMITAG